MSLFSSNDSSLTILIKARDEASKVLQGVESNFASVGGRMKSVGKSLSVGVTAPMVAAGAGAVKLASDFESAFAGIRKTVDATEEQYATLAQGIKDMATEIPASTEELSRFGEIAGQLGVGQDQLLPFIRTVADMGETTNLAGEEAATAFARIANVMGEPLENVDRMGSSIVSLGNNLATTESEIAEYAQRISGAGKIAGLTTADIFGVGAAFSSVGVQAEAGGTAIQKVLIGMTQATAQGGENLEHFAKTAGMSADEFARTFEDDASEAFRQFVEGLGSAGEDAFTILEDLGIADQRLIRGFLSVANAGDLMVESLEIANVGFSENVALQEEAAKRYETFRSQVDIAMNGFKNAGIAIGEALMPVVLQMIPHIQAFAGWLTTMSEKFQELSPKTQKFIGGLLLAVTVLGPLLVIIGSLVAFLPLVAAGFAAISLPVLAIIALLTAIGVSFGIIVVNWEENWETMKWAAGIALDTIKGWWTAFTEWIGGIMTSIVTRITAGWQAIKDAGTAVWEGLKAGFASAGNFIIGIAEGIANSYVKAVNTIINALNKIQVSIPDWVPRIGGKSFGINLPNVPEVKLPRFEFGGLVPGARGKEVPIIAHGGERITPAGQAFGGGNNFTFIMENVSVRSDEDIKRIEKVVDRKFRTLIINNKMLSQ